MSKADSVRAMYDNGELSMDADSKKKAAALLEMTVQTVHATLKKYIDSKCRGSTSSIPKPSTKRTAERSVEKISKVLPMIIDNNFEITDNIETDDGDGFTAKTRPKKGQIFITSAPNKYGLPVTNPPIEIRTSEYSD